MNMVTRAGVEPTTFSLGRSCSIQLSYQAVLLKQLEFDFLDLLPFGVQIELLKNGGRAVGIL